MKINEIIYDITKIYNKYDFDDINIDIIYNDFLINNYISIIHDSHFSNDPIIIKKLKKCKFIYNIYLNKLTINFYVYSCYKLNNVEISKLFKLYKRLMILYKYYNLDKTINIHLSFWNKSRIFPKKKEFFKPIHINGGFTNPNGNDIYIFRKDEYIKVTLHEFIHHIGILNNSITNINNNNYNKLKNYFNIHNNSFFHPVEGIIEFWAHMYNLIFVSIEYSIPFELLHYKELSFTLFQYKKILNKYNFINKWYEETNIFCYIIIKLILLINFKIFLKFNLPYDQNKFVDFIINNYNKYNYLDLEKKNNNNFSFKSKNSMDMMLFSYF